MPNFDNEYGANPATTVIYGGENFDRSEQIISNPGQGSYYVDSKMGTFGRDISTLVVLNETGPANKLPSFRPPLLERPAYPADKLEIDFSLLPPSAEFQVRQVDVTNNATTRTGAISKDLAIDIFIPEANSRKTFVIKGQFDDGVDKNGNGVEYIQFIKGNDAQPEGFPTNQVLFTPRAIITVKKDFESFKAEFERKILEFGGKLKEPHAEPDAKTSAIEQVPQAVLLARAAFGSQEVALTAQNLGGLRSKNLELV
jgi:hypothetical protein